jgi:hypothetical protein
VVPDGEAMSLVPNPLQELERLRRSGQPERRLGPRQHEHLFPLGQPDQWNSGESRLLQDLLGPPDLAAAPIHQDQIRGSSPFVAKSSHATTQDLAHHGKIIGSRCAGDPKSAIAALQSLSVLEDDHGGDRMGCLRVADVKPLNPVGRMG